MAKVVVWGATERRYEVYVIEDGETVEEYSAGNHVGSSQDYTTPGSHYALSLSKMREYAASTAREMADEHGAEYGGEDEDTTQGIVDMYEAIEEGRL